MNMSEDKDIAVEIGKRIAFYRHQNRFSQAALAKLIGIRQAPLSNLEKGKCLPSTRVLLKLSQVFHISVDQLLDLPLAARTQFQAIVHVYGDDALAAHCHSWPHDMQTLVRLPRITFELHGSDAEFIAHKIRNTFGCEHILKLDFVSHLSWEGIHVIEETLASPSALYWNAATDETWIFLAPTLTPEEKNYHAAYALARLVIARRDLILGERWDALPMPKDKMARAITLALLMPNELVSRYMARTGLPDPNRLEAMAAFFGVRHEDLMLRLKMLGMI